MVTMTIRSLMYLLVYQTNIVVRNPIVKMRRNRRRKGISKWFCLKIWDPKKSCSRITWLTKMNFIPWIYYNWLHFMIRWSLTITGILLNFIGLCMWSLVSLLPTFMLICQYLMMNMKWVQYFTVSFFSMNVSLSCHLRWISLLVTKIH